MANTRCSMQGKMDADSHWEWYNKLILCLVVASIAPITLIFNMLRRHKQINADIRAGHFHEDSCGETFDFELWYCLPFICNSHLSKGTLIIPAEFFISAQLSAKSTGGCYLFLQACTTIPSLDLHRLVRIHAAGAVL